MTNVKSADNNINLYIYIYIHTNAITALWLLSKYLLIDSTLMHFNYHTKRNTLLFLFLMQIEKNVAKRKSFNFDFTFPLRKKPLFTIFKLLYYSISFSSCIFQKIFIFSFKLKNNLLALIENNEKTSNLNKILRI